MRSKEPPPLLSYDDIDALTDALGCDLDCLLTLRSMAASEVLPGDDGPACHLDLIVGFWLEMASLELCPL